MELKIQQKIDYIYKEVSNKVWKTGCKFKFKNDEFDKTYIIIQSTPSGSSSRYIENGIIKSPEYITDDINNPIFIYTYEYGKYLTIIDFKKTKEENLLSSIETIGNNIMIGNFINYCGENDIAIRVDNEGEIFEYFGQDDNGIEEYHTTGFYWDMLTEPLEKQSEGFINYFYNLIIK